MADLPNNQKPEEKTIKEKPIEIGSIEDDNLTKKSETPEIQTDKPKPEEEISTPEIKPEEKMPPLPKTPTEPEVGTIGNVGNETNQKTSADVETPEIQQSKEEKSQTKTIDINSFDNFGSKPKKKINVKSLSSILGILIIIAALPMTLMLVKQRQEIRKEAAVSPTVTTNGIKNDPIGETIPTTANGGTYSTTYRITNTTSGSKTVVLKKMSCACSEGGGNPPGVCHNCNTSNETVNLGGGQSIERTISASQPSGTVCGSFQTDIYITSVR